MPPSQRSANVAIIGGGLMGREVAAALVRWPALMDHPVRPRLTAVCDIDEASRDWFDRFETVTTKVADYRDVLADDRVEIVYVAVRHDLHEQIYVDTIRSGKALLAEKPFGIDLGAALRIVAAIDATQGAFVRCSSEIPYFPAAQAAVRRIRSGDLGQLIEAHQSFSHSSDLDRRKPISWKRQQVFCGAAGVMNDLGMHVLHVPLRLGWHPNAVYAVLQNLVPERPGPDGRLVPCDTFENATLHCSVPDPTGSFPLTLGMKRIDPGQKNTWTLRVMGMDSSVEFSTRHPKTLRVMSLDGGEQVWADVETGSQSVFPTVTGAIFEAGFSDAILQMLAAFLAEWTGGLGDRFGCVTPDEALESHRIWDAALRSHASARAEAPDPAVALGSA
jgi:predicted dehydrogenase